MAHLDNDGFDAEAEDQGFQPLPKGTYDLAVVESSPDLEQNSRGTGTLLKVTLQVVDGQYSGRKIFETFNWTHENETAMKIGRSRFAQMCKAVGIPMPKTTEELHNIPFKADVEIIPGSAGYSDKNQVRKFIPAEGMSNGAPKAAVNTKAAETEGDAAPSASAAGKKKATGTKSPPWNKGKGK